MVNISKLTPQQLAELAFTKEEREYQRFVKINEEQVSFYKDDHNDNIFFTGGIFAFETK